MGRPSWLTCGLWGCWWWCCQREGGGEESGAGQGAWVGQQPGLGLGSVDDVRRSYVGGRMDGWWLCVCIGHECELPDWPEERPVRVAAEADAAAPVPHVLGRRHGAGRH